MGGRRPPRDPDVEVGASAKARRLRFRRKPNVKVTTSARVEIDPTLQEELAIQGEGGSRAERHNLPDQVEPNVTYRDVEAGWQAAGRVR